MRARPVLLYSLVLLAATLSGARQAQAQTDTADYTFRGGGDFTLKWDGHQTGIWAGQSSIRAAAGYFDASWHVNTPQPAGMPATFRVYCVDLDHYDTSPTQVQVQPIPDSHNQYDPAALQRAAWLYDTYGSTTNLADSEALQFAIWKTLADPTGGTDVTQGVFRITDTGSNTLVLKSKVQQMLTALYSSPNNLGHATLLLVNRSAMGNSYGQDMIGPAAVTPEPSSIILLLPGLAALGLFKVRWKSSREPEEDPSLDRNHPEV